jgi:hypothetical protein
MTARMNHLRDAFRAGLLPLALLAAACARKPDRERPATAEAAAEPAAEAEPIPVTAEEMDRPSPAAAVVAAFAAVCAEPAPRPVARAAAARGFALVPAAVLREEAPGVALPADATAWRGPAGTGDAVLLWNPGTATCELRAGGLDTLVVEAEFAKLPPVLEANGASVTRLPPPARPGTPRTRQMLLVDPGRGPERARVLRLSDGDAAPAAPKDALVLSARGVAASTGTR